MQFGEVWPVPLYSCVNLQGSSYMKPLAIILAAPVFIYMCSSALHNSGSVDITFFLASDMGLH